MRSAKGRAERIDARRPAALRGRATGPVPFFISTAATRRRGVARHPHDTAPPRTTVRESVVGLAHGARRPLRRALPDAAGQLGPVRRRTTARRRYGGDPPRWIRATAARSDRG